ncbi:MAG: hypothetical protein Q4P20_07115 [Eubacteriales bacterium]|nr:hypothetical protein [Eubacteriales bacterium]
MKTTRKKAFAAILIGLLLIGVIAAKDIWDAFVGSQSIELGYFESENGKTDTLTEEEIQSYIDNFNAQMDRYYARDNVCLPQYKDQNEFLLREAYKEDLDYCVDGGMLGIPIFWIVPHLDGKSVELHANYHFWRCWVEENENGEIEIVAPVCRESISATMVREDGQWKLQKTNNMHMEDCRKDEHNVKICNATYETFEDALAATKDLQPWKDINLFINLF